MEQTELTNAVKSLRLALSDTQQSFAHRMSTAIRTVARWETVRPPSGASLVRLHRVAREAGQSDLAEKLWAALHAELGLSETAGRKINDAAIDVGMASMLAAQLEDALRESGPIAAGPQKILKRMRAKLDKTAALLDELDPYSLTPGGEK